MTRAKCGKTVAAAVGVVACVCTGWALTASHADQPADPGAAQSTVDRAEITTSMDHAFAPNARAQATIDEQADKQPVGDPRDGGGRADCGVLTFTQSASQTVFGGVSVACSPDGVTTNDNAYARCSVISNGGVDVDLKCIQFGIEAINLADHTADIVLSILPAGCPPTTPTPVGGSNEIYRQTLTFLVTGGWPGMVEVELIPSITIPDGTTVIVELQSPDQSTISGMWVGSNPTEPSGDTFIHSVSCGISTYTELGVIGFPGMNWVVNLKGNPACGGTSTDCNANGVPDECDIAAGTSQDCNSNAIPDECDIADGMSQDCNGDGTPDECEEDVVLCGGADIRPGCCPNPLNRSSHGVLPVAVVGTVDFDVTMIDVSSLRLSRADSVGGEVAPNEGPPGPHSVFADVATPFEGESCDCHAAEGDGIDDLSMKFWTQDVVTVLQLGGLNSGDEVELVVTGALLDGTPFTTGGDCITMVGMGAANHGAKSSAGGSSGGSTPPNLNGEGRFQGRKGQETTRPGQGKEGITSDKRGPRLVRRKGG